MTKPVETISEYKIIARRMEPSDNKNYEHIAMILIRKVTLLGNPSQEIQEEVISREDAVRMIEDKQCKFFTENAGKRAYVEVRHRQNNAPYIRTKPDQEEGNNLLSLPTF